VGSRPIVTNERDSCGIGFAADVSGRASRAMLDAVLQGLAGIKHRGALAADARSSDGAGVLLPLDNLFFRALAAEAGIGTDPAGRLGVAMVFASTERGEAAVARTILEDASKTSGLEVCGWREVPVDVDELGFRALGTMPSIAQMVFTANGGDDDSEAERRCYLARRRAEKAAAEADVRLYVASMSTRTVTYKALVPGDALTAFYADLADERHQVPFGVFHMRFSTNTAPSWERAQPFRNLCHNGEINTLEGNRARMRQRRTLGADERIGDEDVIRPVLDPADSDSGNLDAAVELLVRGGRSLAHAVAMVVPAAWEAVGDVPAPVRDFYAYHACLMEPWDGPAGLVLTDGRRVAAALDRNGLRPLRYHVCEDGFVVGCSEAGAIDVSGHGKVRRGRLGPGQMLCVDPDLGAFLEDGDVKRDLAAGAPYGRWVEQGLQPWGPGDLVEDLRPDLERLRVTHGWTSEEIAMIVKPMAVDAKEPTFAMGDDAPPPVLGSKPRPLHHSLRQRFAQVTNPPIDHLRERLVMSLRTLVGPRAPLLDSSPQAAHLLEFPTFFVRPSVVERLADPESCPFPSVSLDATFDVTDGGAGLEAACRRLGDDAVEAVSAGAGIVVVTDMAAGADRVPVPILLATGAVHHALNRARTRSDVAVVVDTGEVRDTHHAATLLGYGCDLLCPRLLLETVAELADDEALGADTTSAVAQEKVQAGIEDGVLKIMSKMGIATVESYRASQLFEAIGLDAAVVDLCLTGTTSKAGGLTWSQIGAESIARHEAGWKDDASTSSPGLVRFRKGGEYHANNPDVVEALHTALGLESDRKRKQEAETLQQAVRAGDWDRYLEFARMANERPPTEISDLLEARAADQPVPLDDVEAVDSIVRRFSTGAMSHGAISREAHEDLAIGMNLAGGRSNSGEGGEARHRYRTRGRARDANSRVKQIASGRFGVTPEYCVYADELQIKMAQGSKPGEGGQIPGHKVTDEIAELRNTQPGVTLISPPPHHDIYSIEDLAQLVYDLKQVNPAATVSVKLVSIAGVGTIAAGVAKALAENVHISGASGGTGASPLSSIKHAGMPWALGLAETQQELVRNGLRGRIRVSVDGGFKTGRDVIVAALLGADEFSFGTAALLAEGCIMVRACHRDTCPTGIATQRANLRAKYVGTPEMVAAYMRHVAQEVRVRLAALGLRSLDEAVGRTDLLFQRVTGDARVDSLDLSPLLAVGDAGGPHRFAGHVSEQRVRSRLGDRVAADAFRALWDGDDLELGYEITNADRTVGAALAGAVALEFGEQRPPGQVTVSFEGVAGQSFGAFLTDGIDFRLTGEANDYVGKAMAGGRIVIRPPRGDAGDPVLAGNTLLYGATGGELFLAGRAGERFAVRNSGAVAVVEGVGQHACEYMTGGIVVVCGPAGQNMCAGMTGGEVFVADPGGNPAAHVNTQLVRVQRPDGGALDNCRALLERHAFLTGSPHVRRLLADWAEASQDFWHIVALGAVQRIGQTQAESVGAPT